MASTLHVRNARIWTGDPDRPLAGALTIAGGRVTAADGPAEAADGPAEAAGDAIDGRGEWAVPGLIDAHVHLLLGGASLSRLDLSGVRSRADFEEAVARRHAELAPDRWLIANGWSEGAWPGAELPDKAWLAAAGDRPVVCYRADLHSAVVNDAVLSICRIDEAPGDETWGGRVVRDPHTGAATGMLLEAALWELVNPLIPAEPEAARREALFAAQEHAHALGLTAVGTMEYRRDVESVFAPLRDELTLRCRVTLLDRGWPMSFDFGRGFPGDDALAVIGYKAFIDGTLGSRTARMLRAYADDPGNRGMLVEIAASGDLEAWAKAVCASGLSPSMHAIGDGAVRLALDVVEAARREAGPRAGFPRIEHAQHVDPEDVERFAGVVTSMQPLHKAADAAAAVERLGAERQAGFFPFRRLASAGAVLAFGSDWPVVSCDPMAGIRAAVTGLAADGSVALPDQNLTVEEALRAYTSGAARALGLDGAGVLRAGALGDLVFVDRDPFAADWAASPPRVTRTIVGGRVVYDASSGRRVEPHERPKAPARVHPRRR